MSKTTKFYEVWAWFTLASAIGITFFILFSVGIIPSGFDVDFSHAVFIVPVSIAGLIMLVSGIVAYGSLFYSDGIDLSDNTIGAKIIMFVFGIVAAVILLAFLAYLIYSVLSDN